MKKILTAGGFLILILCGAIMAPASDFAVSGIDLSSTKWGFQIAKVGLIRLAPDYRFVVATSEVLFPGSEAAPRRNSRRVFITEPADTGKDDRFNTSIIEVPFEVPSAYGRGLASFSFYNVVDTLDDLLKSQKFYQKDVEFFVDTAAILKALIDSGIQAPIFADQSYSFDNYFNRILALMIHREKTPESIAEMFGVNASHIHSNAETLIREKYLKMKGTKYLIDFSIIDNEKLRILLPVINSTVEQLAGILKNNLPAYDSVIAAMAAAGDLTTDPSDLLDGGSILYHKYPTIFGLFFWNRLGHEFVNDGQPFTIFEKNDYNETVPGDLMYLVQGKKEFAGSSFYYYVNDERGERMYAGIPEKPFVRDPDNALTGDLPFGYNFNPERLPILYSYNPEKMKKPLDRLAVGTADIISKMKNKVDELFPPVKNGEKNRGPRYWCWNLITTGVLARLEKDKMIEKEEPAIYVYQNVPY